MVVRFCSASQVVLVRNARAKEALPREFRSALVGPVAIVNSLISLYDQPIQPVPPPLQLALCVLAPVAPRLGQLGLLVMALVVAMR